MRIAVLETGEAVHRYKKAIVVSFAGKRRVLSTAPHNGGYREDLTAVFNQDGTVGAGMACPMLAPTYAEHMALVAEELGLDAETAAGISTAAQMENVSIRTERWKETAVTAIVTGGIEVNGGRAGDPASWYEADGEIVETKPGTINIMLFFNVDLTPEALTRALVTCTEAKTAALQELLAPSRYSMGLATGSGTDGTILAANMDSPICLTNAGKHSKLGELIGKAVKAAVKEALNRQSGLCPARQHQAVRRMDRFGITNDVLWQNYSGQKTRAEFEECLEELLSRKMLVTYTSLYAHLLDQAVWGMLSLEEVTEGAASLRILMNMEGTDGIPEGTFRMGDILSLPAGSVTEQAKILPLIFSYGEGLMKLIMEEERSEDSESELNDRTEKIEKC